MAIALKNRYLAAKPARQTQRIHNFLRRLRAGGRSNMYGAIPYLIDAFGLDREAAFRVVCEWVDQEEAGDFGAPPSSTR
jgi:hypothetical protein